MLGKVYAWFLQRLLDSLRPLKNFFLHALSNGGHDWAEFSSEPPVKSSQTMKASHLHNYLRLRLGLDCINLTLINLNTFGWNHINKKSELWSEKLTLLYLGIKFLPSHNFKYLSQMLLVASNISVVNYNIIIVYHNKVTNEGFKGLINPSHEIIRGIRQTKWHDKSFIQPLLCFKGYFPLISIPHPNLMVSTP